MDAGELDPVASGPLTQFLDAAHEIPPDQMAALVDVVASRLGATRATVWLVDHQQVDLVALDGPPSDRRVPIDGTMVGRAFTSGRTTSGRQPPGQEDHVWFPLLDGVDRIGVLEVAGAPQDDVHRAALRRLASLVAAEVVTRGQYTDLFTLVRRRRAMSLAAEMQWATLPPNTFSTRELVVAGHVEPAYDVGGDCYDYAHNGDDLHLAVFDAVGHDLTSTVVSTLALGAYRHARRSAAPLVRVGEAIDAAIRHELGDGRFVTGQVAKLDAATGRLHLLNAGHPSPLLIRRKQVLGPIACRPWTPFGLGHLADGEPPELVTVDLEPGDAILFHTDGVTESRRPGTEGYGEERLRGLLHTALASGLTPAEVVRRLVIAVLDFHDGDLRDDATVLLAVWKPERR